MQQVEERWCAFVTKPQYDPPRHKMIFSGSESECRKFAILYRQKHPELPGEIEVMTKDGKENPFKSEWPNGEVY